MNEDIEQKLYLSSRKRRLVAFMIDHFVMSFLMVSIAFLILGPNFIEESDADTTQITMLLVMFPFFLIYFAKDSIKGISIGKWIIGIMVRDADRPNIVPSFGRLLIRNLSILIWPIEFIALAVSKKKQRLGDKIVKAIVVKNPNKPTKLPRILVLVGLGVAFFTFTFLLAGTAMKNSGAYKVAVKEIEQNQEILIETGGIKGYGMMPTGSVNISNGYGEAQMEIKVLGNEKDLNVRVYLTKEQNNEWNLIEMNN